MSESIVSKTSPTSAGALPLHSGAPAGWVWSKASYGLLRSMRPQQWTKNGFVCAALLFSRNLFDMQQLLRTLAAFGLFCLISGGVYILNDIGDRERDRHHPAKSRRPIASGSVPVGLAAAVAAVLVTGSLAAAAALSSSFLLAAGAYVLVQILYSSVLKHVVVLDVLVLASGFVIRVVAGAVAIDVAMSSWLLICTVLIALFLALCKRRHELTSLGSDATHTRKVLSEYSPYLLDQMIAIVAAATLVTYALYTVSDETVARFATTNLSLTIPFVIYGIFRYLYLVHQREKGGTPEHTLLNDPPLLCDILLWALTAGLIVY